MRSLIRNVDEAEHCLSYLEPVDAVYKEVYRYAMNYENFFIWPGSPEKHHAMVGGLAIHTAQVLQGALGMLQAIPNARFDDVKVAVVWHDIGKLRDYKRVAPHGWAYSDHRKWIGHLSASVHMLHEALHRRTELDRRALDVEFITHLMLAHHGRRDWGSPVEPMCAEAWAIHAADMLSAYFMEAR